MALVLTSPAFSHQGEIPRKYTCKGENISPPLALQGVPSETKSLVLLMDDPDIPEAAKEKFNIRVWDHWIVFNILPTTRVIPEGKNPVGVLGKNTRGNLGYGGPCPPDREHRYFFKLYALSQMLSLPEGSTKQSVEEAMEGLILAQTELIGRFAPL
jgi:Raf kinase inhibitor-like YbhB/YbcL family protein